MTDTATYNLESVLTLERTVQNVLDKYAADIIPLSDLCYDWSRLNRMFDTSIRQFEQYLPCLKWYEAPNIRNFTMPDDCQEVRAVVLNTPGIIKTDMPELELGVDYTYDKFSNKLNSYLTGLAVQYLAKYSTTVIDISTDEQFICPQGKTAFKLDIVPNPKGVKLITNDAIEYNLTPILITPDKLEFSFNKYNTNNYDTLKIDLTTMLAEVETSIDSESFTLSYTSRYKAILGLDSGAEFFETVFASKLLSGIGNAKAVCKFNSMPNDITADGLNTIAAKLEEEINSYKKSKWWLGIAAIN